MGQTDRCTLYRKVLIALAIVSVPASVTVSILKGMRMAESISVQIGYICVWIGVIVLVSGLCLFAILLNKQLKAQAVFEGNKTEVTEQEEAKKGDFLPTERSIEAFSVPSDMTFAAVGSKSRPYLPIFVPLSEEIAVKQTDSKWSFSSVSQHSASNEPIEQHWSLCHSESPRYSIPVLRERRENPHKKGYIVAISDRDKDMLRQIIALTVISAIIGVIFTVILIVFSTVEAVRKPEVSLAILSITAILEIAVFFIITVIFTMEIEGKSKENLQFVSELALKLKDVKASLHISPGFKHLYMRFHAYLGLEPHP